MFTVNYILKQLLITDVRLSVSPATIELLNRVLVTMTGSGESKDVDAEEQINHPNLWSQKQFTDADYWFLRTGNDETASPFGC